MGDTCRHVFDTYARALPQSHVFDAHVLSKCAVLLRDTKPISWSRSVSSPCTLECLHLDQGRATRYSTLHLDMCLSSVASSLGFCFCPILATSCETLFRSQLFILAISGYSPLERHKARRSTHRSVWLSCLGRSNLVRGFRSPSLQDPPCNTAAQQQTRAPSAQTFLCWKHSAVTLPEFLWGWCSPGQSRNKVSGAHQHFPSTRVLEGRHAVQRSDNFKI